MKINFIPWKIAQRVKNTYINNDLKYEINPTNELRTIAPCSNYDPVYNYSCDIPQAISGANVYDKLMVQLTTKYPNVFVTKLLLVELEQMFTNKDENGTNVFRKLVKSLIPDKNWSKIQNGHMYQDEIYAAFGKKTHPFILLTFYFKY